LPAVTIDSSSLFALSDKIHHQTNTFQWVRPGEPGWPSEEAWLQLKKVVNGNLIKLKSPLFECKDLPKSAECNELFKSLKNPYFIGDNPALTQTSGWLDAWQSKASVYAVAAKTTSDVVEAVNFARNNNLRLVVKGGGHSYQGTSNSVDSLLIWTREMNNITILEDFVPKGCEGLLKPQPAVAIQAGALWLQAYNEVTTKAGRYVQGGGCMTVGVAGFILGGGFGSFSKNYGLGAAALLEAEIVTSDGSVKIVNASNELDLFWALKGGGGGSFGVVTKLTLRTRELPEIFGAVLGKIKAKSNDSFKRIIVQLIKLYQNRLFNPHWGEQIIFHEDNSVNINMLFLGLSQQQAHACWQPFEEWVKDQPEHYTFEMPLSYVIIPARHSWDPAFLKQHLGSLIATDDRPNAPRENIYWLSNREEAGQFLFAYQSVWLPSDLLNQDKQHQLATALFNSSRYWTVSLHFNKGLAGSPAEEIEAAKNTAMNPAVLSAFALVIIAGDGEPAFKGIEGHEPDLIAAKNGAKNIKTAMNELLKVVPVSGTYVSESNFFEKNWQQSFWGTNYSRLAAVKKRYDPNDLFFVHHGVGSEEWSDDGFTKFGK
jgi:FAD/FMN-containing dehydrogenase